MQVFVIGNNAEDQHADHYKKNSHQNQTAEYSDRHRLQKALFQIQLISHHKEHQRAGRRSDCTDTSKDNTADRTASDKGSQTGHPKDDTQQHSHKASVRNHVAQHHPCGQCLAVGRFQHRQKSGIGKDGLSKIYGRKTGLFAGQQPVKGVSQHTALGAGQQKGHKFSIWRGKPAQSEARGHRQAETNIHRYKQHGDGQTVFRCKKSVEQHNRQCDIADDRFQTHQAPMIKNLPEAAPAAQQKQN